VQWIFFNRPSLSWKGQSKLNTRKNGFVVALTLGFSFNAAIIVINVFFAMGLNVGSIVQTILFDVVLLCATVAISFVMSKVCRNLKHAGRGTLVTLAIASFLASSAGAGIVAMVIPASIHAVATTSGVILCFVLFFELKKNGLWF
jgi:hypothetical protein